jgi:hypothetical protein
MVTSTETYQEIKRTVVPGEPEVRPYTVYSEKYIWDLDPTTLVPVGVRVERTPI